MISFIIAGVFFALSAHTKSEPSDQAATKFVILTKPTQTEYGLFGRGRQMPFVGREGPYVRVRYLEHEVLIPISATDLYTSGDAEPDEGAETQRLLIANAVQKGQVVIGMTADECRLAWGKPLNINRDLSASNATEQWVYSNDRYLYFDNGLLKSIQDSTTSPGRAPVDHTKKNQTNTSKIQAGFSHAKSFVSSDDYRLLSIIDNIKSADISFESDQFRLGVRAGQWIVIDKLAHTEQAKNLNSENAISQALDFAKQSFHEMRQLQKKLAIDDNILFKSINHENDRDARRQFDLYERWD